MLSKFGLFRRGDAAANSTAACACVLDSNTVCLDYYLMKNYPSCLTFQKEVTYRLLDRSQPRLFYIIKIIKGLISLNVLCSGKKDSLVILICLW